MCGIAGIVKLTARAEAPGREPLLRMVNALAHRGPDEFGLYRDDEAGLAHARLAIIDVAGGQQPLGDMSTWVVFNGEIFNYLELREELIALGRSFRTRSDTEVVLQACETWGESALNRFNGQWAIALWDTRSRRLTLTRDRFGVRPLYFCEHAGHLYFASEIKSLFAAQPDIPRAFDAEGLAETFTFWGPVAPRTVFRNVSEVRPGHLRTYQHGRVSEKPYWRPAFPANRAEGYQGTFEDATGAVREKLFKATELRVLRSDVPVGSYLSGGLDSALVAAIASRVTARLQTFSLRFEDAEYDETHYQRVMAVRLASDHHDVVITRKDIAEAFPDVVYHAERPLLRTAPAPLYLLSQLVRRQGLKVVLTGEGADEVFAGYDLFKEGNLRRFWSRHAASTSRPRLLERLYPYLARSPVAQRAMAERFFGRNLAAASQPGFGHETRWGSIRALSRLFSNPMRETLANTDVAADLLRTLPSEFGDWSALAQDQYLESRTLLSGYLLSAQGDRMLMGHSVEGRFPFLDVNVVALADSLPAHYKLRALREKRVLKAAAQGLVPDEIIARHKQPYRAPDAASFLIPEAPEYIQDMLQSARISEAQVFDPAAVQKLWTKCISASPGPLSNSDNMAMVGVISTQLLHDRFVRACPVPNTHVHLKTDIDKTHAAAF